MFDDQLTPDSHSNQDWLTKSINKDKDQQQTNNNRNQVNIQHTHLTHLNNTTNLQAKFQQGTLRKIISKNYWEVE